MNEEDLIKQELQAQLEEVKQQLIILGMIEDRLLKIRNLSQKIICEELTEIEIKEINKQVQNLEQQVLLLESKGTKLS